jgi:hypothetical protein
MLLQETVPNMMSQESEVLMGYPGYNKIISDRQSATSEESASLFDAINQRFLIHMGSRIFFYPSSVFFVKSDCIQFAIDSLDRKEESTYKVLAREN